MHEGCHWIYLLCILFGSGQMLSSKSKIFQYDRTVANGPGCTIGRVLLLGKLRAAGEQHSSINT